jgi:hypothetical protein
VILIGNNGKRDREYCRECRAFHSRKECPANRQSGIMAASHRRRAWAVGIIQAAKAQSLAR